MEGAQVNHAYTHAGKYKVTLTAVGLDGLAGKDTFLFPVTGYVSTKFIPEENRRYTGHR
jgi:PKD repeat protein